MIQLKPNYPDHTDTPIVPGAIWRWNGGDLHVKLEDCNGALVSFYAISTDGKVDSELSVMNLAYFRRNWRPVPAHRPSPIL